MSFFNCTICSNDFSENYNLTNCCKKMLCETCYQNDDLKLCPYCKNDEKFNEKLLKKKFTPADDYILEMERKNKELQDTVKELAEEVVDLKDELETKTKKGGAKEKKSAEKNSIEKKVITQKDRTFTGYVMKYIPDQTELIMNNKGDEIKCIVDYETQSYIDDEGEQHKSLNMVYTKFYKRAGAEKIQSKNCWDHFKMDGKKINDLYE